MGVINNTFFIMFTSLSRYVLITLYLCIMYFRGGLVFKLVEFLGQANRLVMYVNMSSFICTPVLTDMYIRT